MRHLFFPVDRLNAQLIYWFVSLFKIYTFRLSKDFPVSLSYDRIHNWDEPDSMIHEGHFTSEDDLKSFPIS